MGGGIADMQNEEMYQHGMQLLAHHRSCFIHLQCMMS